MAIPDEEQPLLRQITHDSVKHDEVILDFEPLDPEDPRNWTQAFKWFIVLLLACMAFTVTFTCIGVAPISSQIVSDLTGSPNSTSSSTTTLLVTIWELGEAAGPLLIAPLSEVLGRYPVINGCNIAFIIWTLVAATSRSTTVFILARMATGLAVSAAVLNPAIIGDMFVSTQRGSAMSILMLAPLIGGAVGPAVSGAIAQTLGWRTVLLIACGFAMICEVLFFTCFRETYKMAILRSRLHKTRVSSGESFKKETGHENMVKLFHSITRPFAVLFGSSVLMLLSLFAAVAFSYFYVFCISLPSVLMDVYDFKLAQTGSAFMTFSIGSFLGVMICNFSLDRIYISLRDRNGGVEKPEFRLPLAIVGAFTLPLAMTAYGWIAQWKLPVALLLTSVAALGLTLLLVIIPLSAYVVDAFGLYSASAMTGIIVTRCVASTFLPLATDPLVARFGYGWGCTCFGALSLSLAVIPVFVMRNGDKMRQKSEFSRDV